jgi:hypothetical protein
MRTVTPTSLVSGSLLLLGVYAPGETPNATEIANGVEVANDLIDDWATQGLTIPSTVREVFTLTAGQQTYSIGSGGDFDTVRPQSIDAASILINPADVQTLTSITRSGSTATATLAGHGYSSGANITISGAVETDYNGTFIITVTSSSTFTYTVSGTPTTPATGTITAQDAYGSAFEMFCGILNYQQYISIPIKGLPNNWPTALFYNATFASGLGTIYLYPMPNRASRLVLYSGRILAQLDAAALTADIILPPAATRALKYNLALELLPQYPRPDDSATARIERNAAQSLANFKRSNDDPVVLSSGDSAALFGQTYYGNPFDFFSM